MTTSTATARRTFAIAISTDDGVSNTLDACDFTPAGIPVDSDGRPFADLNLDCRVDLLDYATFQRSLFKPD